MLADFVAAHEAPTVRADAGAARRRQDRETGDWSSFWQARDYLRRVGSVRASVFAVHGLNDFNVKTEGVRRVVEPALRPQRAAQAVAAQRRPRRPGRRRRATSARSTAGSTTGCSASRTGSRPSRACTSSARTGRITTRPTGRRPARAARRCGSRPPTRTRPAARHRGGHGRAEAVVRGPRARARHRRRADRSARRREPEPARLPLAGAHPRRAHERHAVGRPADVDRQPQRGQPHRGARRLRPRPASRRWSRAAGSTRRTARRRRSQPISKGRAYSFRWDLQPDDHVFAAGHRIGLVVVSTDHDYTLRPNPGTELTLDPAASDVRLPIVGGAAALGF